MLASLGSMLESESVLFLRFFLNLGHISGIILAYLEYILGISLSYFGHIFVIFWAYLLDIFGQSSATGTIYFDNLLGVFLGG